MESIISGSKEPKIDLTGYSFSEFKVLEEGEPKIRNDGHKVIRCPHGHILGVCCENGTVEIRHKGRTAVINSPNANVQITCEQCGKMVTVYLDCGRTDVEECI